MQNQNSKFQMKIKDRAYAYSIQVIGFLDKIPKDSSASIISRQLLRSATSIGANIIEAQASSSKKDFKNFINHSLKSANESLYWWGLLRDAKRISDPELHRLFQETQEIANILGSSMLTLKGRRQ